MDPYGSYDRRTSTGQYISLLCPVYIIRVFNKCRSYYYKRINRPARPTHSNATEQSRSGNTHHSRYTTASSYTHSCWSDTYACCKHTYTRWTNSPAWSNQHSHPTSAATELYPTNSRYD